MTSSAPSRRPAGSGRGTLALTVFVLVFAAGCTSTGSGDKQATTAAKKVTLASVTAVVGAPLSVQLPSCSAADREEPQVAAVVSVDGKPDVGSYESIIGTDTEKKDRVDIEFASSGEHTITATCYPHSGAPEKYAAAKVTVEYGATLGPDATLAEGGRLQAGGYRLVMQADGNLAVYAPDEVLVWDSGSGDSPGARARLAADGNLVVVNSANKVVWASDTGGNDGASATLQPDGNLVLTAADGRQLWASGADDAATVPPAAAGNVAEAGQAIRAGQRLTSPNGRYSLAMQPDGNLVLYAGDQSTWMTRTGPALKAFAALQPDGNLVVRDRTGRLLWTSGTAGATSLALQDDGNLVLRAGNNPIWMTGPRG